MNKAFVALFVCALAAVASADAGNNKTELNDGFTQYILPPLVSADAGNNKTELNDDFTQYALASTDSAELSGLKEDQKVFEPFCISSRDDIFQDIEQKTNAAAAKGFTVLFSLVEAIGSAGVGAISFGNNRLTPQIADPSAQIDGKAENEIEASIIDGQRAVAAAQSQPKSFVEAFKSIVAATSSAVSRAFNQKIAEITQTASTLGSTATLEAICEKAASYEADLQTKFETFKQGVAEESPEAVNAAVTLNNVPCLTSTRVIRINSICQFAKSSAPAVSKLWATRAQKN